MLQLNKKVFMALGLAFMMAGPFSHPAEAGLISSLIDKAKDVVSTLSSAVKSAVGGIKDAGKTIIDKAKYDAKKLKGWIDDKAPGVISKAFDKASGALNKLTGAAGTAAKAILAHRDIVENALVFGLQHGKTLADIGLDIVGLIPGVNIPAEGIHLALDALLPTVTTAVETAVKADQAILMGK